MKSESIQREIMAIKNDSIHGWTIILSKIIDLIQEILTNDEDFSVINLNKMLLCFINAHPMMAIIVNFANDFLFFMQNMDIKNKEDSELMRTFLESYTKKLALSNKAIQNNFLKQ